MDVDFANLLKILLKPGWCSSERTVIRIAFNLLALRFHLCHLGYKFLATVSDISRCVISSFFDSRLYVRNLFCRVLQAGARYSLCFQNLVNYLLIDFTEAAESRQIVNV